MGEREPRVGSVPDWWSGSQDYGVWHRSGTANAIACTRIEERVVSSMEQ
jgi:hypothetical protein